MLHGHLYTVTLVEMHTIARDAGMSFALGRAAYLKSRMQNHGHRVVGYYRNRVDFTLACIAFMRKARATTAKRWQAHILQGGSVRAISCKSHAKDLARRRKIYAKYAPIQRGRAAYRSVINAYCAQAVASGMPQSNVWYYHFQGKNW